MRKSIIVAASQNGVIGKDNQLPWRLPGDLRRFKALTLGHTLIMGRKTYESLPPKMRPLPGRTTIMISREATPSTLSSGLVVENSLDRALRLAGLFEDSNHSVDKLEPEVFVCGGGEVYKEALPLVDRVYLTVVERDFEGDTYFPFVDWRSGGAWVHDGCERGEGELPHRFEIWDRVR